MFYAISKFFAISRLHCAFSESSIAYQSRDCAALVCILDRIWLPSRALCACSFLAVKHTAEILSEICHNQLGYIYIHACLLPLQSADPLPCPNGSFSPLTGLESDEECQICLPGRYCSPEALTEPVCVCHVCVCVCVCHVCVCVCVCVRVRVRVHVYICMVCMHGVYAWMCMCSVYACVCVRVCGTIHLSCSIVAEKLPSFQYLLSLPSLGGSLCPRSFLSSWDDIPRPISLPYFHLSLQLLRWESWGVHHLYLWPLLPLCWTWNTNTLP